MNIAIYSRVSTDKQDTQNQLLVLREFAKRQQWTIVKEFVDVCTGGTSDREHFQLMFQAAERKEFQLLLFWSLDRLSREGTLQTLTHLAKLANSGVGYRSHEEQYLDTTNPMNDVFVAFTAVRAREEKLRIGQRTKAGLAMARLRGAKIGRPARVFDVRKARELAAAGNSKRSISRLLNIPMSTLRERLVMKGEINDRQ